MKRTFTILIGAVGLFSLTAFLLPRISLDTVDAPVATVMTEQIPLNVGAFTEEEELSTDCSTLTSEGCLPQVSAEFTDCKTVTVCSAKNLSNVVIDFAPKGVGEEDIKYDGLRGKTLTFEESDEIMGVWIKSGCNDSGDCPGCGEYVEKPAEVTCSGIPDCVDENDPNPNPGLEEDYISYYIEFEGGTVFQGTATTTTITEMIELESLTIDISCADAFWGEDGMEGTEDDGFGQNGDPTKSSGHPRVIYYSIFKYKIDAEAETCDMVRSCTGIPTGDDDPCLEDADDDDAGMGSPVSTEDDDAGEEEPGCPNLTSDGCAGGTAAMFEDCYSVVTCSSRDISNVVIDFAPAGAGPEDKKYDDLSGYSKTFMESEIIYGVWIKSGCNNSGDCSGCGEYHVNTNNTDDCDSGGGDPDPEADDDDSGTGTPSCNDDDNFLFPLPVELNGFSAHAEAQRVVLEWETLTELNNDYFAVERSVDGVKFEAIGFINGQGTTNVPHYYKTYDANPQLGLNYYRLKQVDFDGTASYSPIAVVEFETSQYNFQLNISPNPARQTLNVKWNAIEDRPTVITIFDQVGRQIREIRVAAGENNHQLDVQGLNPGAMYILQVSQGEGVQVKRFIKMIR